MRLVNFSPPACAVRFAGIMITAYCHVPVTNIEEVTIPNASLAVLIGATTF